MSFGLEKELGDNDTTWMEHAEDIDSSWYGLDGEPSDLDVSMRYAGEHFSTQLYQEPTLLESELTIVESFLSAHTDEDKVESVFEYFMLKAVQEMKNQIEALKVDLISEEEVATP